MDQTYDTLDRRVSLPSVATIPASRPLAWLRSGWPDLRAAPLASLSYGLAFALAGWAILYWAADRPHPFAAAVSGFLLFGPIVSPGLYELSRHHCAGQPVGLRETLSGRTRGGESIAHVGLLLALIAIAWAHLSAVLFALLHRGDTDDLGSLIHSLLSSGEQPMFLANYVAVGTVLAAVGLASLLIVLILLVPLLGHATCHAYRESVR